MVLVPELTWSTAPAVLDSYARANLVMRTADPRSGKEDVYLTLGKGARSGGVAGRSERWSAEALPGGGLRLLNWTELEERDREFRYGGTIGSVGQALLEGNRRWALASDDASVAPVAATAQGVLPAWVPGTLEGIGTAVRSDVDVLFLAIHLRELPVVLAEVGRSCTLVVSSSTPNQNQHLGVLAVSPTCGLGAAGLASASTHHAHLATLPDVSATLLSLADVKVPSSLTGEPVRAAGPVSRDRLVRRDQRTWTADRSRTKFVWLFVVFHAVGAVCAIWWSRSRVVVGCTLLAIAGASFLMMLVPWWREGAVAGLVVGGLLAFTIACAGVLIVRRHGLVGLGATGALVAAVVVVDALFGSPLEIDAPFGNSPVVAGRFFGVGNIGSGFLVAGLVVAGGVALDRWGLRAVRWVLPALVAAVVVGAAPQFGADVGGILFAIPAYGLLLLSATRRRLSARHALLLAGAAVAALLVMVAVDVTRGSAAQTHLARSLTQGDLRDQILRKATRALQTVRAPMANIIPVAIAALVLTEFRLSSRPAIRHASYALVLAALLGSVINDSGVNVGAAVAAIGWPFAVAAQHLAPSPSREAVHASEPSATTQSV